MSENEAYNELTDDVLAVHDSMSTAIENGFLNLSLDEEPPRPLPVKIEEVCDYLVEEPDEKPATFLSDKKPLLFRSDIGEEFSTSDISVQAPEYFDTFKVINHFLGFEEAYVKLNDHESYSPYLEDFSDEVPSSSCRHFFSNGFFSVARKNARKIAALQVIVPSVSFEVPGNMELMSSISVNIGKFIRTLYVLEDMDYVLVYYVPNVDKLTLVAKVATRNDYGIIEWKEAFHALLSSEEATVGKPDFEETYSKYPNYSFLLTAESQRYSSIVACNDPYSWIRNVKHLTKIIPKWDTKCFFRSDVKQGEFRPLKIDPTSVSVEDAQNYILLRRQRCTHPSFAACRYIYLFSSLHRKQYIEKEKVLYQYVVIGDTSEGSLRNLSNRSDPQLMNIMREFMHRRDVHLAKQALKDFGLSVSSRQIWNAARRGKCSTFARQKVGAKQHVDLIKLAESTLTGSGGYTVIERINGMSGFHIQLLRDNFECVLANLPTKADLIKHRKKVKLLESLKDRKARNQFVNKHFLPLQNDNGYLKGVTGIIMVDVTFGISPWYVTIVHCSVAPFATFRSMKMRFIPIALIYHPKKDISVHLASVAAINKMHHSFGEKYSIKRFSALLTDGEIALSVYKTAMVCEDVVHLKCALHMRDNMTGRNKKVDTSKVFGSIEVTIAGPTDLSDDESDILKSSQPITVRTMTNCLLGAYTKDEYDQFLEQLMNDPMVPEKVKKFVNDKQLSIYEFYSLRQRLMAGIITQYATTNIIEGYNNTIKPIFEGKKEPAQSLPRFLAFCREQMDQLCQAVMGKRANDVVYIGPEKWDTLMDDEKSDLLSRLGLRLPLDSEWSDLPIEFVNVITPERLGRISLMFSEYAVVKHTENLILLVYDSPRCKAITTTLRVDRSAGAIRTVCQNFCEQKSICCDHQLLYFLSLDTVSKQLFIYGHNDVEKHKRILSANTVRGTGSKRKGQKGSKPNFSRKIDRMKDGSFVNAALRNGSDDELSEDSEAILAVEAENNASERSMFDVGTAEEELITGLDSQTSMSSVTSNDIFLQEEDSRTNFSLTSTGDELNATASDSSDLDHSSFNYELSEDAPNQLKLRTPRKTRRKRSIDPFKSPAVIRPILKKPKNQQKTSASPAKGVRFAPSVAPVAVNNVKTSAGKVGRPRKIEETVVRKAGRPRKIEKTAARKVGRPRKTDLSVVTALDNNVETAAEREERGRPRQNGDVAACDVTSVTTTVRKSARSSPTIDMSQAIGDLAVSKYGRRLRCRKDSDRSSIESRIPTKRRSM